jgi:polysaccharide biosynthesis/export protein
MNLRSTALALCLLPSCALAQQAMTRPILSAPPATATATPPSPNPSAQAPPPGANSTRYVLAPEDSIAVTVWKEPSISGTLPIRPDGMISLSLLGDLQAAGYTPMQLSTEISKRLEKFIQDPNVTVTVLAVRPKEVYMLGEIQHVGAVPITPDMTPLQAIAAAGGLSPFAKAKRIYILREQQGKQVKIPFDYKKAIRNGDQQGLSLTPGDTIVVP